MVEEVVVVEEEEAEAEAEAVAMPVEEVVNQETEAFSLFYPGQGVYGRKKQPVSLVFLLYLLSWATSFCPSFDS